MLQSTKVFNSFFSSFLASFFFFFLASASMINAQTTGTYRLGDPNVTESAHGILEIKPAVGQNIEFRLTYTDNSQKISLQGTAVVNAKNKFVYTKAGRSKTPCQIQIQDNGHEILLLLESNNLDCDLPTNFDISGTYQKISNKADF